MSATTHTIREIVDQSPATLGVFKKFGIDICKHGSETLDSVSEKMQLSYEQLDEKLSEAQNPQSVLAPQELSAVKLIQHIVRTHHQYVRRELPALVEIAERVAVRHGEHIPSLIRVKDLVNSLHDELMAHLAKEEEILFPYIAQLEHAMPGEVVQGCFKSVNMPIFMMHREHDETLRTIAELRSLTNDFVPPPEACTKYRALFNGLKAFEVDIVRHIHLENDLLFPRAQKLELERQCSSL
jgi:regulator of cell morphogenesis and NO signaling